MGLRFPPGALWNMVFQFYAKRTGLKVRTVKMPNDMEVDDRFLVLGQMAQSEYDVRILD